MSWAAVLSGKTSEISAEDSGHYSTHDNFGTRRRAADR